MYRDGVISITVRTEITREYGPQLPREYGPSKFLYIQRIRSGGRWRTQFPDDIFFLNKGLNFDIHRYCRHLCIIRGTGSVAFGTCELRKCKGLVEFLVLPAACMSRVFNYYYYFFSVREHSTASLNHA